MVHDEKVGDYIHENQGRFVKEIVRLASQPSVSARKEGISECAAIVKSMIEEIGGTTRVLELPGVAPMSWIAVLEPENARGDAFGAWKLEEVVRRNQSQPPAELADQLLSEIGQWQPSSTTQQDDITLIVIDVV